MIVIIIIANNCANCYQYCISQPFYTKELYEMMLNNCLTKIVLDSIHLFQQS